MLESFLELLTYMLNLLLQGPLTITGAMLWGFILYLICLPLFFRRKELTQKLFIALLFLYTAALLQSNLCPTDSTDFRPEKFSVAQALVVVEWNPFLLSSTGINNLWTTLLNDFSVLMPIGVFIPLTCYRIRLGKMLILSIINGISLELFQLFANIVMQNGSHIVSTGEAILSAAGCLTGYLILTLLRKLPLPKHKAQHYAHPGQAL